MWLLSPVSDSAENSFLMYNHGYLNGRNDVSNSLLIRPTVYLKSNVYITDGDGSKSNPYHLGTTETITQNSDDSETINNGQTNNNIEDESNINIESTDNSKDKTVVNVPSTLSTISNILLITSGVLIIVGIGLYGYNYYRLKKNNK